MEPTRLSLTNFRSGAGRLLSVLLLGGLSGAFAPEAYAQTIVSICDRTDGVEAKILAAIPGSVACDDVTSEQLAAITTLNLYDQSLTALQLGDFASLTNLQYLGLGNNGLTSLPANVFDGLTNLRSLGLTDNRLTSLTGDMFNGLTNLQTLLLWNNGLTSLTGDVFNNLTNLRSLQLSRNNLTSLPANVFNGLTNLHSLGLWRNPGAPFPLTLELVRTDNAALSAPGLAEVKVRLAEGAPSAMTVDLSVTNGRLSQTSATIPKGGTQSQAITVTQMPGRTATVTLGDPPAIVENMVHGVMHGNSLQTAVGDPLNLFVNASICDRTDAVETKILAAISGSVACDEVTREQLAAITTLSLNSLPLTALQSGDFAGLTNLQYLHFYRNGLTSLPEDVFNGLTNLKGLYLRSNNLTSLPGDAFSGLTKLQTLNLSGNGLTSLPEDVFNGLTKLQTLDITSNNLTSLPEDVFNGLDNLRFLYLVHNRLTSLPGDVFNDLTKLKWLALGDNRLTSLPGDVFNGLTNLQALNLLHSGLTSLPGDVFNGLTNLRTLDLSANPGAPFPLTLELARTDNTDLSAPGPAEVKVRLAEGAPWAMTINLSVTDGTLSQTSATIPKGATESQAITVTQMPGRIATVTLGDPPALDQRIVRGNSLRTAAGDPLPLFNGVVSIPDTNLRTALESALNKSSGQAILRSELGGLRSLEANNQAIANLTGLEYATGLTTLTISTNNISDISALSDMSALETLNLNRNNITDLTRLSGLTALRMLRLNSNGISDIAPLAANRGLGSGDTIDLRGNADTLSAVAYSTHIPALQGRGVTVQLDPAPPVSIPDTNLRTALERALNKNAGDAILRSDLAGLTALRANNRGISDLTGLENATGLTTLTMGRNRISDISALSALTNLQILNLNLNNLSASELQDPLMPLSGLTNLTTLKLHSNGIVDISSLSDLTNLQSLKLQNNRISDIQPLVDNVGLGNGDSVQLKGNPLNADAYNRHILALQSWGVTVQFDPRPSTAQLVTAANTQEDVVISIRAVERSVIEGEPAQFQLTAAPAPRTDLVVAIAVTDPHGVLPDTPPTQVTIEADQTTLTLELETDDDDIDELDATVTVTLEETPNTNYTVAAAPDNSASITVIDNDGLTQERRERGIEYALGAFGRAAGWDLVETIRNRSHNSTVQAKAFEITNLPAFGIINMGTPGTSIEMSSIDLSRLLDSEIKIAFNPQVAQVSQSGSSGKSPLVRAWINASRSDVESSPFEGRTQEGELTIGRFGIDAAYGSGWLVGSVFSWHDGNIKFDDTDFDTTGEVGIDLLSINPYVSYTKNKLHLWGTIGGGFGDLSYEDSPGGRTTSTDSDLRMLTAAAGAEYEFGRFGPFDLKGRGESMVVNLDTEDSSHALVGYEDIGVTVYGARGELELGLPLQLDNNQTQLRPYVFTGLRQDGGLGNDLVLEYGGGFALSTGSLVAEGSIRSQGSSEDDAVELRGYSISLAYDRGNDRKGLVAKVEQSAGPSGYDPYGAGALSSLSSSVAGTSSRLHVGYGIGLDENLLRPFVAMGWRESQESELDLGLEYQYSDGRASLVYSGGDGSNLRFRFTKLF